MFDEFDELADDVEQYRKELRVKSDDWHKKLSTYDSRFAIVLRDLHASSFWRILAICLLIQLVVAGGASLVVFGATSVYDTGTGGSPVVLGVTGDASDVVVSGASGEPEIVTESYSEKSVAMRGLNGGILDGVVVASSTDSGVSLDVYVSDSRVQTELVQHQFSDTISEIQYAHLSGDTPIRPSPESSTSYLYYLFTHLLVGPWVVLSSVMFAGSIVADRIARDNHNGVRKLFQSAGIPFSKLLDARSLVAVVSAELLFLMSVTGLLFLGIPLRGLGGLFTLVIGVSFGFSAIAGGVSITGESRRVVQRRYWVSVVLVTASTFAFPVSLVGSIAHLASGTATSETYAIVGIYIGCGLGAFFVSRALGWVQVSAVAVENFTYRISYRIREIFQRY